MPGSTLTPTVVLLTTAFPLDAVGEVTFIRPELDRLRAHFEHVVVVPAITGRVRCDLPDGIEIDHSLSQILHPSGTLDRPRMFLSALACPWFLQELRRCPKILRHPGAVKRFLYCVAAAQRAGDWLHAKFLDGSWHPDSTITYSYWLNYIAAGLGRARRFHPSCRIISRAHGADIYEDRYVPRCFPLHPQAIAAVDRVFVASEAGKRHLADTYPDERAKLSVAPLGSPDPGFLSTPSGDGTFRMVSCSSLDAMKRVDLLVASLGILGRQHPDSTFQWCHMGDGPMRNRIETLCRELLPANVKWNLAGRLPPERVIAHYRDHPVDLFISTTASEGGRPVSMTEALGCGIPVAATSVGGVPELIFGDHGWLMPGDPSPETVAEFIGDIASRDSLAVHRQAARSHWEEHLRAEALCETFARQLRALIG